MLPSHCATAAGCSGTNDKQGKIPVELHSHKQWRFLSKAAGFFFLFSTFTPRREAKLCKINGFGCHYYHLAVCRRLTFPACSVRRFPLKTSRKLLLPLTANLPHSIRPSYFICNKSLCPLPSMKPSNLTLASAEAHRSPGLWMTEPQSWIYLCMWLK